MNKIEKKIKKESIELIESSLPEISSLDNIQVKPKKTSKLPLLLVPFGTALAVSVIIIPLLLNKVQHSNPNGGNDNTYPFIFDDYKPTLSNFNEVVYYSYFAYHQGNAKKNNLLQPNYKIMLNGAEDDEGEKESLKDDKYIDEFGRAHYPIPTDMEYTFKDFLYFEFDSGTNPFIDQRIGNGHIYGLSVCTNIMDNETMLILKNGEYFYSCLCNGSGWNASGEPTYVEFSAHKTIEGFDLIKDITNKRYLTLNFGPSNGSRKGYETLTNINVEGFEYTINPNTVFYDPTPVNCDLSGLKALLGNNPDFEIFDGYGGSDALVYDNSVPETNTFNLEEFEGTFTVAGDGLYLNEAKIIALNSVNKIYASEINKDAYRDLVFESIEGTVRTFNIFDVQHRRDLYVKQVSNIKDYDYYLNMRDNRLVVNLYKKGYSDDKYLLDYGYFAYSGNYNTTIVWQNLFELAALNINGAYEADGVTPVALVDDYYYFSSNTPYIIEVQLSKFGGSTNPNYPDLIYQVECSPASNWQFLSMENGVYCYQMTFEEKGYLEFKLSFYRYSRDFYAAVDGSTEIEPQI